MRLSSIVKWALALFPALALGQVEVSIAPAVGDGEVELSWEAEAGARYEPRYSTDLVAWTTVEGYPAVAAESGATEPLRFDLADGRLFFKVLRWDGSDTVPPADASGFVATGGDRSAVLSWTDTADEDVAWYEITWSPGGAAATIVQAGEETFTATGLSAGASYTFTIKTVDTSGNRSAGATATVATDAPPPMTVVITPNRVAMSQFETIVLTATVEPKPEAPLRFEWFTYGIYGALNGDQSSPSAYVEDNVTDGISEVTYTATVPGSPESINVTVYLASEESTVNDLAYAETRLEISGPKQTATMAVYEYTTDGPGEGRVSTEFITAEIIEAIPAVVTYVFKLEKQPGEGWNFGPLGITWNYRTVTQLRDSAYLIEQFGSDIFGLGDKYLARIGRGGGVSNYRPDDPVRLNALEGQRAHYSNWLIGEWSVTPNTFWKRWDE